MLAALVWTPALATTVGYDNQDIRDAVKTNESDFQSWDVSRVTDASGLFDNRTEFNADLSRWDTRGFTNTARMFRNATSFAGSVACWDTTLVENSRDMFAGASSFLANPCLTHWAHKKKLDLGRTRQSSTTVCDAASCRFTTELLKRTATAWCKNPAATAELFGNINTWQIGSVTSTEGLFGGPECAGFDTSLEDWDVSGVDNMAAMFAGAPNMSDCTKSRMYAAWKEHVPFFDAGYGGKWYDLTCDSGHKHGGGASTTARQRASIICIAVVSVATFAFVVAMVRRHSPGVVSWNMPSWPKRSWGNKDSMEMQKLINLD
jgi:hypothetical protein